MVHVYGLQEIVKLLVIYLKETAGDGYEVLLLLCLAVQAFDSPLDHPLVIVLDDGLEGFRIVLITLHRIGFSCARLPVAEYGGIVSLHDVLNKFVDA